MCCHPVEVVRDYLNSDKVVVPNICSVNSGGGSGCGGGGGSSLKYKSFSVECYIGV